MKILIISDEHPDIELGGAARIAYQTAQWLAREGHDVAFLAATTDRTRVGERLNGRVREILIYIPRSRVSLVRTMWSWRGVRAATAVVRTIRPDVVHAHGVHRAWSFAVLPAVRPHTKKLVWTAHDAMSVSSTKVREDVLPASVADRVRVWWSSRMIRCVDSVIAVSDALASYLVRAGLSLHIKTLHNAIDVDAWRAQVCHRRYDIPRNAILLSGRLSGSKGLFAAIDALRRVRATVPDCVLVLAGGPESAHAKAVAYAADATLIQSLGPVRHEDMRCVVAACTIVVSASMYLDPFPTVNLEALALGVPVVGTRQGGTPEIVLDGVCGRIIDPADSKQFADALVQLLLDDVVRSRLGDAGFAHVRMNFNAEQYTKSLMKLYS